MKNIYKARFSVFSVSLSRSSAVVTPLVAALYTSAKALARLTAFLIVLMP